MLSADDVRELKRLIENATRGDVKELLRELRGPATDLTVLDELASHCRLDHCASLIFPGSIGEVEDFLSEVGFRSSKAVPSVVVRRRLSQRYEIPEADLDVGIVHATQDTPAGGTVGLEIFCLPPSPAIQFIVSRERVANNERHIAILITNPDIALINSLAAAIVQQLLMKYDGGGYNPHDDTARGGRNVLYFKHPGGSRLELTWMGVPDAIAVIDQLEVCSSDIC